MLPTEYPHHSLWHLLHPAAKVVLLAEENDDVREQLATELIRDGYHVVEVEDGFELCDYLELASSHKARGPDLIVSDVELSGRGGLEVCQMVTDTAQDCPFILLAPHDDGASWVAAEKAGATQVLDKPVDLAKLRAVVDVLAFKI